jgi:sulfur carrier protein
VPGGGAAGAGGPAIRVLVNGDERTLPAGTTVAELVAALCERTRGVAVAVDREVVPRSTWGRVVVTEGSMVEVVAAAAGG